MRARSMGMISMVAALLLVAPPPAEAQEAGDANVAAPDKKRDRKAEREAKRLERAEKARAAKEARERAREEKRQAAAAAREAKKQEREAKKQAAAAAKEAKAGDDSPGAGEEAAPEAALSERAAAMDPRARRQEARKRFQEATAHIRNKRYGEAVEAFSAAQELDPQPDYLFNLGVAHHLHGDELATADDYKGAMDSREKALEFYQQYLATRPSRARAQQTQQYMDDLGHRMRVNRELLGAQEARRDAESELARARKAMEDAEAERQAAIREAEAERERIRQQVAEAERERDRWRSIATEQGSGAGAGKRVLGSTLLVAGGLALGAAAFYGLDAQSANDQLNGLGDGDEWTVSRDWLHSRGEASESRMILLSAVGAGLIVGGATLYLLGERDARRPPAEAAGVAIVPAVGPTSAGVQVSGRF